MSSTATECEYETDGRTDRRARRVMRPAGRPRRVRSAMRACRHNRVCWWNVNDDDELPGHPRRPVTDVPPPATTDTTTTNITSAPVVIPGECTAPPGHDTDADYTQLNHVVRQSDVLKSVSLSYNVLHATQVCDR